MAACANVRFLDARCDVQRQNTRTMSGFPEARSDDTDLLDTQRLTVTRYWQQSRQAMVLAVGLHTGFGIAGLLMDALPLTLLQIVSIVVYCTCYALSARGRTRLIVPLTYLDLLGHSTLACWIMGQESGFQFYSWILLPLLFTNVNRDLRTKARIAFTLCIVYVAIDWWLRQSAPLVQVAPAALEALRYFNMCCFLLTMVLSAIGYSRSVADAEARLRIAAETDALTGLLNRRRMSDQIHTELARARSGNGMLAVMLLDLDHFKTINDRYGHTSGDLVLAQVSAVLRRGVREGDVVARWGGEEFLILLPSAGIERGVDVAERIRNEVRAIPGDVRVSITVGVAVWRDGEDLEATIHRADAALYEGKRGGRDRVVVEAGPQRRAS
jgi:diguanylate cyclase (GGDEF)-like protein